KSNSSSLWMRVHLPQEPALKGQKLHLRLTLAVTWPEILDKGDREREPFTTKEAEVSQAVLLVVGPPGSGPLYARLWTGGLLAAAVVSLTGAVVLARAASRYRRQALPTTILVPEPRRGYS